MTILEEEEDSLLFKGFFGGKAPRFETRSMLLDLSRFVSYQRAAK